MNNKLYFIFFILLIGNLAQAQMFDYSIKQHGNNQSKVETNSYNEMTTMINNGFNLFEENLRALSLWEVKQYKRVILEIEAETEGMPPKRKNEYKNKKIIELSFLLNDKEMEMQYQYIELIDFFNDKAIEKGLVIEFIPMMQIEGRLQDAAFKMASEHIVEQEKQENIHDYAAYGTDGAIISASLLMPATAALAATASTGVGIPVATAATIIIVSGIAIEVMISYSVDKIIDEFLPNVEEMTRIKDWYFINGLCVNARKTYIEQVNSARSFKILK